jgi:hypothetical protein
MTDEDFQNLEHAVERQDGELDLLSKRIEELAEDLKVALRLSPNVVELARQTAKGGMTQSQWATVRPNEPDFRERCLRFFERYRSDRGG